MNRHDIIPALALALGDWRRHHLYYSGDTDDILPCLPSSGASYIF